MTAHSRLPNSLKCSLPLLAFMFACGDGDTVVAVNLSFQPTGQMTQSVAVSISQPGQSPVETTLTIPMKTTDAGTVIDVKDNRFVQRVTLPASYADGETTVSAVAKDAAGATVVTGTTKVDLHAGEAIAAYIQVGEDPSKKPADKADAGPSN